MLDASIVEKESYFAYIDGLRGVAVLMILVGHVSEYVANPSGAFHFQRVSQYFSGLQIGVDLFFILSAFTLFNTSRRRFQADRHPFASFYVRRAFRILPFWWLAVAVWAITRHESIATIASGATFFFGFIRFKQGFQDPVPGGWSLFVEETFYLLLPLILLRIKSLPRALAFLAVLLAVSTAWTRFAGYHAVLQRNYFYYLFPLENWFAFAFGIVAFYLVVEHGVGRWIFGQAWMRIASDAIVIAAVALLIIRDIKLATFSMFLLVIGSSSPRTLLGRFARIPLVMRFGRYCYSIYLTHFLLLYLAAGTITRFIGAAGLDGQPIEVRFLVVFPIVAAISLTAAFFTFNFFEKPCIALGKRLVSRINRGSLPELLEPAPQVAPAGRV